MLIHTNTNTNSSALSRAPRQEGIAGTDSCTTADPYQMDRVELEVAIGRTETYTRQLEARSARGQQAAVLGASVLLTSLAIGCAQAAGMGSLTAAASVSLSLTSAAGLAAFGKGLRDRDMSRSEGASTVAEAHHLRSVHARRFSVPADRLPLAASDM